MHALLRDQPAANHSPGPLAAAADGRTSHYVHKEKVSGVADADAMACTQRELEREAEREREKGAKLQAILDSRVNWGDHCTRRRAYSDLGAEHTDGENISGPGSIADGHAGSGYGSFDHTSTSASTASVRYLDTDSDQCNSEIEAGGRLTIAGNHSRSPPDSGSVGISKEAPSTADKALAFAALEPQTHAATAFQGSAAPAACASVTGAGAGAGSGAGGHDAISMADICDSPTFHAAHILVRV